MSTTLESIRLTEMGKGTLCTTAVYDNSKINCKKQFSTENNF